MPDWSQNKENTTSFNLGPRKLNKFHDSELIFGYRVAKSYDRMGLLALASIVRSFLPFIGRQQRWGGGQNQVGFYDARIESSSQKNF